MTNFDENSLKDLVKLCRIEIPDEEKKEIVKSMQDILRHMEELNRINTDNVIPCNYVLRDVLNNVVREDEVGETLPREVFLANAPDQIGGMVRVPSVMKS